MEGATTGVHKRPRLEVDESSPESPEAKRVRDNLLDILEDGDDDDRDAAWKDLALFLESFKEEVGLPEPPAPEVGLPEPRAPEPETAADLSYLLEASDDDLGLPPAAVGEGEGGGGFGEAVVHAGGGWGLEEEAVGYEFGGWWEEDVALGGFLDCYFGEMAAATDVSELPWQGESLTTV